jgi:S-disulfanyl-L-cysteine oxidoreductase SoxD
MRKLVFLLLLHVGVVQAELGSHIKIRLGVAAPKNFESVAAPDGSGLPTGNGSATEGKVLYMKQCAGCHGLDGKLAGNAIAGGVGTLTGDRPFKTVGSYWPYATTLFDYINRAMPYGKEKSLNADEVYAFTSYVLYLSGIVSENDSLNEGSLTEVQMPNRDGFRTAKDYVSASLHEK